MDKDEWKRVGEVVEIIEEGQKILFTDKEKSFKITRLREITDIVKESKQPTEEESNT